MFLPRDEDNPSARCENLLLCCWLLEEIFFAYLSDLLLVKALDVTE
jgi:hypothetical protein